ncbi:MAG: coenzyme F420-0:L-glutamate ligase, partial [Thermoproteota archaeon]
MSLTVSPLFSERKEDKFDVFEALLETLDKNDESLQEGDVIVVSTKYISNSQGRLIDLANVKTSKEGTEVSRKFQIKEELAEIILRESDKIFGGISGFVITSADNIMAPNAG